MEITILELITKYGMNTVIIASLVFVLTGLIKKPIKILAKKMNDGSKLTRYITFLPIILGFLVTVLYNFIMTKNLIFDGNFFTLWLTSSSLSLAIYAFKEKFLPSKNKILSEIEVKQNEELIEQIKQSVLLIPANTEQTQELNKNKEEHEIQKQKIILRGNLNGQASAKDK